MSTKDSSDTQSLLARIRRYDIHSIQRILKAWLVVFSGLVIYSSVNGLAILIIARRVLPVEYGQYVASFALATFLVLIPSFGIDNWLLTQYRSKSESATQLWMSAARVRALLLGLWIIVMIPITMALPDDAYPPAVFFPTAVGVAFDSLLLLAFAALRSRKNHSRVTLFQIASSIVLLVLALTVPVEDGRIALFAISRAILSAILAIIVYWPLIRLYLRQRPDGVASRLILGSSWPFLWADIASNAYVKADLTIVSLYIGPEAVGVYGPAINLLQFAFLPSTAIFFFIVPELSQRFVKDRFRFSRLSLQQLGGQAAIGIFTTAILFFFAEPIIELVFTSVYSRSIFILQLLAPIATLRAINKGLGAILMSGNRQTSRTKLQLLIAAFNIGANIVIIRFMGLVGVALVYIVSELLLAIGYIILSAGLIRGAGRSETFISSQSRI